MDYTYKRAAVGDFDATRETVERSVTSHGFEVRHVHDLQATLASKGFPIQPLCIFELWLADTAQTQTREGKLLMPCRLHLYVEDGEVCLAAIRPTLVALMFPEVDFAGFDARVEDSMVRLVDRCAGA